ncbi:MAG: hypothetical protein HQL18_03600 [Candidatus Omnitrophica bacterium]|nr:hypothetical protein [Candidatus Omnitrophota bacterium]
MINFLARVAVAAILGLAGMAPSAMAYYKNNPPNSFKKGPFHHVSAEAMAEKDVPSFIKKSPDFSRQVYSLDVDGNGTRDYVVFVLHGKDTLLSEIHIYLGKPDGGYRKISFVDDIAAGIEDIVDIKGNGKWEVILGDIYTSKKQKYLSYSVYQFKNERLVNADKRFKGFPKFVWFTRKNNDKDTIHVTAKERKRHVCQKNAKILYEDIKRRVRGYERGLGVN